MSNTNGNNRDRPVPPDSVARRLELLSIIVPHRYRNEMNMCALIHVESLPPEGNTLIF